MLKNNLKLAFRTLWKNKFQTFILVGGLAAGMTACLLLLQYAGYHLSFDQFHSKRNQICRVVNERFQNGKSIQKGTITYPTIGAAMQQDFPEVVNHTRVAPAGKEFFKRDDKLIKEDPTLWTDEHFLEMFDFPVLARSGTEILSKPDEMAITRKIADQFFPGARGDYSSILGQEIYMGQRKQPFRITAVLENVPPNSLLQFDALAAYATLIAENKDWDESWTWSDFWHFLELAPGTDMAALQAKLPDFSERRFQGEKVSGSREVFTLQPLKDAHLFSTGLEYEIGETSNGRTVWSLLIVAFFILVIAWINYVNLSSVRAMERAREVGVRKVIGAHRGQLVLQFMSEAFIVNIMALILAFGCSWWIKPWFSNSFDIPVQAMQAFPQGASWLIGIFAALIVTGIAASGAYPAWLMSSSPIAGILKGILGKNTGGAQVRKGLVVFQFTASIALILCAWMVSRQMRFMSSQSLGVNINQVLKIDPPQLTGFDSTFIDRMESFKNTLQTRTDIASVCTSNRTPGDMMGRVFRVTRPNSAQADEQYTCNFIMADKDYAKTYGLELAAGRFFRETDHNPDFSKLKSIVLTEAAVKMFGFPSDEAAIGQTLNFWNKDWSVVGVMKDFHQKNLHNPIEPILFGPAYGNFNTVSVRLTGNQLEATIGFIGDTFRQFFPGNIFKYSFADADFQKLYDDDARFGQILSFFTLIALLIASLGLFGLASYTTILRTKEIGIRKVLGASLMGITALLAKDFLKLVLIAIVVASPLAWYFIQKWLADFAYRSEISWWMFALTGFIAVSIAFLTVSFQSIRAALANPVKSLRSE